MSDLFLRRDERGRRPRLKDETTPGLRITHASGVIHFIPAGHPALALALMNGMAQQAALNDPATRIEFGIKTGSAFVTTEVLKEGIQK